jgi:hypothetical protein
MQDIFFLSDPTYRPSMTPDTPFPAPTPSLKPFRLSGRARSPVRPPPPSTPNGKKLKSLPREPDGVEWEVRTRRMDPLTLYDCWGNPYDLTRRILSPAISEKSDTLTRASTVSLDSLWSSFSITGGESESLRAATPADDAEVEVDRPLSVRESEGGRFHSPPLPYHVSVNALTGSGATAQQFPSPVSSSSNTSDTSDEREDWERDIATWRKGQRSRQAQWKQLSEGQPARRSSPLAFPRALPQRVPVVSGASNETTVSESSVYQTRPPSQPSSHRVHLANSEGPTGPVRRRSSASLSFLPKRDDRRGGGGNKRLRRVDRRNSQTLEQLRAAEERYRQSIVQSNEAGERKAVGPGSTSWIYPRCLQTPHFFFYFVLFSLSSFSGKRTCLSGNYVATPTTPNSVANLASCISQAR